MMPLAALLLAYLLGAIPFGYLLVKWKTGGDVRGAGSGNIGATNVARTTGWGVGVATLLLDIGKGYAAVWAAGRLTGGDLRWMAAAAVVVMLGHAYTVFLRFRGGKAVASFVGAFLCLTPLALAAVLVVFVGVVAWSRYISAGSIVAAAVFPLAVWLIAGPIWPVEVAAVVSAAFIIYKHSSNIQRLRAGTERVQFWRKKTVKRLAVIGGGAWGTALAIVLAPRFERVRLWVYESDVAKLTQSGRRNDTYLPGFQIPDNVLVTHDLSTALEDAAVVVSVMPSHHVRRVFGQMMPFLTESMTFVSATKGLEVGTILRMSEVIRSIAPTFALQVAALSGPTFAKEVARGDPTALVVASPDEDLNRRIQEAFSGPTFRLYTSPDTIGVEIGGSIKNVIAIGSGVIHGMGLGHNVTAALITRGLAEMTRLAVAMGGRAQTLAGLAGLGDLVLTCTGELSRNRMVGVELARGRKLDEIVGSMNMVAEGIKTTGAAVELARRFGVEMPITEQMYQMLYHGLSPREAIRRLMERSLKGE